MTATVTRLAMDSLAQTPGQALVAPAPGLVVAILIVVFLARVLLEVADVPRSRDTMRTLDVVLLPMFIALAFILSTRVLEILPLG
jgi:hypothetical protein